MLKIFSTRKKSGFTLVELIIVLGILTIFLGTGIALFGRFADSKQSENEVRKLSDVMGLAKKKSSTSDIPPEASSCSGTFLGYSIYITATGYTLLVNCSTNPTTPPYPPGLVPLQQYTFQNGVTANATMTVDFPPLNGKVVSQPQNGIRLMNTTRTSCFSISVSEVGSVETNQVDCADST